MQQQIELNRLASLPVLLELRAAGFDVDWISDLYAKKLDYRTAVPILLKWLPILENQDVKETIVRALSTRWAKPKAVDVLISEFYKTDPDLISYKWAIANALSIIADDSAFSEISALVLDKRHGKAREMLAVALGNMKNPSASEILIRLLDDDLVSGHAIIALGKLKSKKAYSKIQLFLTNPKPWIRKEARKALSRIDPSGLKSFENTD